MPLDGQGEKLTLTPFSLEARRLALPTGGGYAFVNRTTKGS